MVLDGPKRAGRISVCCPVVKVTLEGVYLGDHEMDDVMQPSQLFLNLAPDSQLHLMLSIVILFLDPEKQQKLVWAVRRKHHGLHAAGAIIGHCLWVNGQTKMDRDSHL